MRGERREQRRARRRARKEEGKARVDIQRELNELLKTGELSKDEWKARSEELDQEALEIDRIRMIRHYEEKYADLVSAWQAAGHRPSIGGEYRKAAGTYRAHQPGHPNATEPPQRLPPVSIRHLRERFAEHSP